MLIVDLSRNGFPAAIARLRRHQQENPYASRADMQAALHKYIGGKITRGNKKTGGSAKHITASNLKLDKSQALRSVSYLTTGLAITSANYLWQLFAGPSAAKMQADLARGLGIKEQSIPAYFGLTAAEVEQLAGDRRGVCPGATKGCMAVCLVDAGQQGTPPAKAAQIRRQLAFKFSRDAMMAAITIEIINLIKQVWSKRSKNRDELIYPAIRLNINSDISWENITFEVDPWLAQMVSKVSTEAVASGVQTIHHLFRKTEVIFYDYTKQPQRFMRYATDPSWPKNYFLTFSLSENPLHRRTAMEYIRMVQSGKPVRAAQIAVPLAYYDERGKRYARRPGQKGWQWPLPKTLTIVDERTGESVTAPVVDGDPSDARFDDAQVNPGSIAGLRFKEVLSKSRGGTMAQYSTTFIDPSIKRGFILRADAGNENVIIGIDSGARQLAMPLQRAV